MFSLFQPTWKKEALASLKSTSKFLNYKRDILPAEKVSEILSLIDKFKEAIKANDQASAESVSKEFDGLRNAISPSRRHSKITENVEVFFVAVAIALGLRAYVVQPFRIPTGSMQPTLNGIRAEELSPEKMPSFVARALHFFNGTSFKTLVADREKSIVGFADKTAFLFTRTEVKFDDGSSITLPAPIGEVQRIPQIARHFYEQSDLLGQRRIQNPPFKQGEVIFSGAIEAGDLVLVDKISYHFRKPNRGEVFVFDTRGISGISERQGDQAAGQHYIKRLVGTPRDTLSVHSPELWINGAPAQEAGMQRVAARQDPYNQYGYIPASAERIPQGRSRLYQQTISAQGTDWQLRKYASQERANFSEYAAFGDNTNNSLDSRFWGPVRQFNIVGPAAFSLWPITKHWGLIR